MELFATSLLLWAMSLVHLEHTEGVSPPASLVIRPNRTQLFEDEFVSLSCEPKDKSAGWRLRWSTHRDERSQCPQGWRSETRSTCSTSRLQTWDRGVYWCESESGQHSNAVNLTVNRKPSPVVRVSPQSWLAEGDSVTLSCEVRDTSLNWTFLWYRAVLFSRTGPSREHSPRVSYNGNPYHVELLPDSSRGAGGSYTLSPAALEHTGLYVCRVEGGDPTYQTDYSDVQRLWVTGVSPPASLVIRPNRTQLFEEEFVSLSCEPKDKSAGWRLRWSTHRDERSQCPQGWRSETRSACSTSRLQTWDRGVYWCESESGQHSNAVNLTMNRKPHPVLRVSPQSWLAEGDSVTLSCEVRDTSLNWTFLWYRAVLFSRTGPSREHSPHVSYNGKSYHVELLPHSSRGAEGSYTLGPAALEHTGLYVCRAEGGDPTYQTDYSDVQCLWVTARDISLESPDHPVTERDSLTLRSASQPVPSTIGAKVLRDRSVSEAQTTPEITSVFLRHKGPDDSTHPQQEQPPEQEDTGTGKTPVLLVTLLCLCVLGAGTMAAMWLRSRSAALQSTSGTPSSGHGEPLTDAPGHGSTAGLQSVQKGAYPSSVY